MCEKYHLHQIGRCCYLTGFLKRGKCQCARCTLCR